MRKFLEDYREIVGDDVMSGLHDKARRLYGKNMVHINSTYQGGGVAEKLTSIVPLMNDVGIEADWRILRGTPDFFMVTKKFHNALQGEAINLTAMKRRLYVETNEDFSIYARINHNYVVVHDPQPLPLIRFYQKRQPWIWRCHVDLSHPHLATWHLLKEYIDMYDLVIVSSEDYKRDDLPVEQRVIAPAIDPLSSKNEPLSEKTMMKYLAKNSIPIDKPLVTQISRFDKWKDPEGVIEVFKKVKGVVDCRLVLCGSMASDDPDGAKVYERIKRKSKKLIEKGDLILVNGANNIVVNALQRASVVVLQKSTREGFGLTITEAMWKETPVVASDVGGIRLQIEDGKSGYLVDPMDFDAAAKRVIALLRDMDMRVEMGRAAKERVRENFLVTRLIGDYLDVMRDLAVMVA